MGAIWQSPSQEAIFGFLIGTGVTLLIGVIGFGDPWKEVIVLAVGAGISLAFVFNVVAPTDDR